MPDQKDIVEIMADGAFRSVAWSSFWSRADAVILMQAALTALSKAGMGVVRVEEDSSSRA